MPSAHRPTPAVPEWNGPDDGYAPRRSASGEHRLLDLADRCVQCGLCLPACPTYGHDRLEAESPRGRIALVRAWALDTVPPSAIGDAHLDHCLGCRSCEAVCPAGVQYGELLVEARARQRSRRPPGWKPRLLAGLAARPAWLRTALALYRLAYPALPARLRPLPRPPAFAHSAAAPDQGSTALFAGCVAGTYEADLRDALRRLASASGVDLTTPPGQTCCGSLHAHAGDTASRDRLAAVNRRAFAHASTVLTLASGCHEAVSQALTGTVTRDAIDWLASRANQLEFRPRRERVALHLPCTQRNVVGSAAALRGLLARVPELEVVELTAGYGCCGASGLQMVVDPDRAADYREPLLDQFRRSGATRLLSANIGCRLHLATATPLPVQHPLELLAECVDAAAGRAA